MHVRSLPWRLLSMGAAVALGSGLLAGCSSGGSSSSSNSSHTLTVWSEENLPARMAVTKKLIAQFTKQTGIKVNLVGVDEDQVPQLIQSSAAAGKLPDVIGGLPLAQLWQMQSNKLLNTSAAANVLGALGRSTFNQNAIKLVSQGTTPLAVPSDSWQQILVYRKDLFAKAHLPTPDTYANMVKGAQTLNKGSVGGMSIATDPKDVFTQQSFEDLAVANNCQMVTASGKVSLDSPQCVQAFKTYGQLAATGPSGTQTVDTTRATYFTGQSSMIVWSTYLLDSLAGLDSSNLPSCPQCRNDKSFLSHNSGIVTALQGADGAKPSQFGEISSWAITQKANASAAQKFVQFMMSDGYEGWIGMQPDGKIPVRSGTTSDKTMYVDAWRGMNIGVSSHEPLDKAFSKSFLDELLKGVSNMQRWGITEGQGALVGATEGELPVPKAISAMAGGDHASPQSAAEQANSAVEAIQKSLH